MTTAANQGDVAARRRTRTWLIASAAVVAGTVLGLVRIGGVGATNSLFAEDGTIFVTENTNNGTWTALTTPYNAYLHTVPRIAAALVGLFPVRWTAAGLALFSAGLVALLALVVYEASSSVISSRALRGVPRRGRSSSCPSGRRRCSTASRTCSGILIGAAGLCMLWRPRSRPLRVVGVLVIAAAALSQPLTVLLLPIVILRFRRDRRVDLFIGSWLIALCGYGLALVRTGVHRQDEPGAATIGPARAVEHFVVDVIGRGQYGFRWLDHSRNPLGVLLMGLSILAVAAAAFYVIRHRPATTPEIATLAATSVLVYFVPVAISRDVPPRYSVAPIVLLLTALLATLDVALAHMPERHTSPRPGRSSPLRRSCSPSTCGSPHCDRTAPRGHPVSIRPEPPVRRPT